MKMTFAAAVGSGLKNFAKFKGTATRTEFWYFYLFTILVNMVTSTIDLVIAPGVDLTGTAGLGAGPTYILASIALVLPNLSLIARRFRDAGFSGKWLLLWILPFVIFIATGAINLPALSATASDAELVERAVALLPTLAALSAVGIFQFVLYFKPTKTAAQGNKYADPEQSSTSALG